LLAAVDDPAATDEPGGTEATMTQLNAGEPTPWFYAPSPSNPSFNFSSVAGRYVLLGFTPSDESRRNAAFAIVQRNIDLLDDHHITSFIVLRDQETYSRARDRNGVRWFFDPDGALSRLHGALGDDGAETPIWVAIDPSLRILFTAPFDETEQVFARLRALPAVDDHAGTPLHAPVMITPRLFDADLCRRLIAYYDAQGGLPSGVMREVDGRTVGVLDDFKNRRDALVHDKALQDETRVAIYRRLVPEIEKAFRFKATRVERYIVARYAADEGGYFRPHRDNLTAGTAHRQFACSINLNAEDFEGGDLRFPEYGMRTYRPPTGGAVVFSCSLLHEATPVTRGARYAFLPFLYDEAGNAVRQRNLHLLGPAPNDAAEASPQAAFDAS
jgi:predicted 2-oxoglutarate/Fe(II)-dependent dioxygenase YbiX/peroxiredoxin